MFWYLLILRTHGPLTHTGLPASYFAVSVTPETMHRLSALHCLGLSLLSGWMPAQDSWVLCFFLNSKPVYRPAGDDMHCGARWSCWQVNEVWTNGPQTPPPCSCGTLTCTPMQICVSVCVCIKLHNERKGGKKKQLTISANMLFVWTRAQEPAQVHCHFLCLISLED